MKARDIMTTDVFSVDQEKGFNEVEISAELKHVRHIPVVTDDNEIIGILSIRDLLSHLSNAAASHFTPIKEIMNKNVITSSPDTSVQDIAKLMRENTISCVPIIEDKKLVGIVSEADFLKLADSIV